MLMRADGYSTSSWQFVGLVGVCCKFVCDDGDAFAAGTVYVLITGVVTGDVQSQQ